MEQPRGGRRRDLVTDARSAGRLAEDRHVVWVAAECADVRLHPVQRRVALHGACGCGGAQRRLPTGGAAYGMPSHSLTPLTTMPHTGPVDVCTTGVLGSQGTAAAEPFDVATTSAAVASIAQPSRACRKIDLIIASSSSR